MRFTSLCLLVSSVMLVSVTSAALACSIHDKMAYKAAAENFCAFLETSRSHPDKALFTPALQNAIAVAEKRNAAIAKAHPGEKPPLGDGVPYQAFPDHADFCRPGQNLHIDHQLYMEVAYIFADAMNANWTDRLKLVKTDAGWKIDDIVYGPDYNNTLRGVLRDVGKASR